MKSEISQKNISKKDEDILANDMEKNSKPSITEQNETNTNFTKMLIISFLILFVIGIFALGYFLYYVDNSVNKDLIYITQPMAEKNKFNYFTLENGLRVLLVDPGKVDVNKIGMSSVALTVGVGSESDPKDFMGFTHLIEHLLFTGSKNYPEDNYIEKVVNEFNGQNNGCTKSFTTSYFYTLHDEGTEKLLDVLADAYINPNFTLDLIKKELNNINSEISMRMTFNKNLAYYKLIKKIGNPESQMFSDGFANIDPKGVDFEDLQKRLIAFHEKYYSANLSTLTIISNVNHDLLKEYIQKSFSPLVNKKTERPLTNLKQKTPNPFTADTLKSIYYLKSDIDVPSFTLVFQVPSQRRVTEFHPLRLFSIFLNFYSKDSLIDKLFDKNLMTALEDEIILSDYHHAIYGVSFNLVSKNQDKISQIVSDFYSFVEYVKSISTIEEIFKELSHFSKLDFMFDLDGDELKFYNTRTSPFNRVLQFSEILQENDPKYIFTSSNILYKFNLDEWKQMLEQINPENSIILYQSKDFKIGTEKEKRELKIDIDSKLSVDDKRALSPEDLYETYLDKSLVDIVLTKKLDFDEDCPYENIKLPDEFFFVLKKKISTTDKFEIYKKMDSNLLSNYNLLNNCATPEFLANEGGESMNGKALNTSKLFDLVFDLENTDEKHIELIKQFEDYKDCLNNEFIQDTINFMPTRVAFTDKEDEKDSYNDISLYELVYRKTFQPKTLTLIEVQSEYLSKIFDSGSNQEKMEAIFKVKLFCKYFRKHMKKNFIENFLESNKVECKLHDNHFLIEVESLNSLTSEFIDKIFMEFKNLKKKESFNESLLNTMKESLLHNYAGFDNLTALDLYGYFLNSLIDKLFIDASTPEKLENINNIIHNITPENLIDLSENLFNDSTLEFLYLGQPIENMKKISQKVRNNFNQDKKPLALTEKKKKEDELKTLFNIPLNETNVFRLRNPHKDDTNSVYSSYFYIGLLNKARRLCLNVIVKYLRNYLFDELRNKRNLGYVASGYLKVYYHNMGIVVLLQGEKFLPHDIEKTIEETLKSFITFLKTKSDNDLKKTAEKITDDIKKLDGTIKDITDKIFYYWSDEKTTGDEKSYEDALNVFKSEDVFKMVDEIFTNTATQKRIILELFSKDITEDIKTYKLGKEFTLTGKEYIIKDKDTYLKKREL